MSNHSNEQYPYPQNQQNQQYGQQPPPQGEYGQDAYGTGQQPPSPYGSSYGDQAYPDPQAQAQQPYQPPQGPAPAAQDPYSTQTWQGQTWDTQYQPVQPVQPQNAAADTAYLPPQNASGPSYGQNPSYDQSPSYGQNPSYGSYGSQPTGSQPLPPEVPAQQPEPPRPATGTQGTGQAHAPYDIPPAPAPAYSSPATRGNARITDAQRARAEGRSPIIEPGTKPALITAVLAALLAGAAVFGQFALVVPVVLLQAVTAAGWFRLNGMWPARQGIALAFLGGVVADVAILAVEGLHAPAAILGTLGIWVLLTVVLHLRNGMPADERMYALTAGVTTAALTVVAAGHLAASPQAMTVGGIAVAVAVVARALPLPTIASVAVALLAAAGSGIAVGGVNGIGSGGALIGLGAGVCALVGLRVASYDYPSKFVHMTAGVALPLTAAAPAVYLLGRAFA
ncbi:hypothetical protein OG897_02530 [Streptomyces sp. NBC_00237]|uniref:hypothetical protein n=1 Tax=Streptomyces sp. NBC_00237 TaxID=2975687 RepID=UPI00224D7042|nr:hypothetical protein [Streptomyces sp. NBC_00237]MCX5200341.1 hypothetical protein [Streptomyces sp. NBC_00237]